MNDAEFLKYWLDAYTTSLVLGWQDRMITESDWIMRSLANFQVYTLGM